MPFIKISGLTTATAVSATNQFEINQNGGSRSATVAQVAAFARTSATDPVVLPAGTVSAPALTFTGDTNTGIYSPGADTIAFTEGGVEAMRIDGNANVGIGTSFPARRLEVLAAGTNIPARLGNSQGNMDIGGSDGGTVDIDTRNWPMALKVGSLERMRIDTSGNVGIGTSSPTSRLTVAGGASPVEIYQNSAAVRFSSSPNRTNNYYLGANISDSVDAGFIIGYGTDIGTGTPRIIINSSGNVGVGGSPGTDSRLRIEGTESRLRSVNTTSGAIAYFGAMSPNEARAWSVTGTDLTLGTSNAERMRITAAGLVGIGVSAPGSNLDVANSGTGAATNVFRIFNATDGASAGLLGLVKFGSTATSYGPYAANNVGVNCAFTNLLFGTETFQDVIFYTHNNERIRITAAGNVGIGTSLPTFRLVAANSSTDGGWLYSSGAVSILGLGGYGSATDGAFSLRYDRAAGATTFNGGSRDTPVERMRIDNVGNVGIGTSTPQGRFNVGGGRAFFGPNGETYAIGLGFNQTRVNAGQTYYIGATDSATPDMVISNVFGSEVARFTNTGRVGIGTASPGVTLDVRNPSGNCVISSQFGTGTKGEFIAAANQVDIKAYNGTNDVLTFTTGASERMRIDQFGNVGFGTSSPDGFGRITSAPTGTQVAFMSTQGGTAGYPAFGFSGQVTANGNRGAGMYLAGDGILAFSTMGSERARIQGDGNTFIGRTGITGFTNETGLWFSPNQGMSIGKNSSTNVGACLYMNRMAAIGDGNLVEFAESGTLEGTISISGTTVSYNGGHLSRWSQLPTQQRNPALLKGTVLSNLDEMCEWLDAEGNPLPNEQLNRMKISDVEGDTNVAGVFVNWDNDDQINPYDMNIAMTGDMIIRIAAGVVVQKGMLLMSAGDGTAKPQGDDIVRSKTIAKVTSNHVTCTYPDGSYCVPCVLMAC